MDHNDGRPAYFEMFVEDITDKRILERQFAHGWKNGGGGQAVGRNRT